LASILSDTALEVQFVRPNLARTVLAVLAVESIVAAMLLLCQFICYLCGFLALIVSANAIESSTLTQCR
jgi:hypothetical protein